MTREQVSCPTRKQMIVSLFDIQIKPVYQYILMYRSLFEQLVVIMYVYAISCGAAINN